MSRSFKKNFIFLLFVIAMTTGFIVPSGVATASPIGCTIYSNPTQVTYPGTLDYCETTPPSWCEAGTLCCGVSFPTQISQNQFNDYRRNFLMNSFYTNTVTPDFQSVTDESRNPALLRVSVWGAFIDASLLNDTLKDLGILNAKSVQAYTPSEQICKIGTLTRALSASEAKMDNDRLILGEVGLAKNLGRKSSISAAGMGQENEARLRVFVEKFCDLKGNNNGMSEACAPAHPVKDTQHNNDIDYTRLMNNGVNLNADLTDTNVTQDETSVMAMSHYLYGHLQPKERMSVSQFGETPGAQNLYSEYRSVVARRAAAQNSYNTLAAMKMAGSGASDPYIQDILQSIGLDGYALDVYLAGKNSDNAMVDSSYNSQMNLLTKVLYQSPAFYANLMDSKANVKRTSAALQGIGLMQQRDTYKSMARSEMLAALLVELEAREIANNVYGKKTE